MPSATSWAPSAKHGLASPKKKWEPIQFDPELQWPCILANAPSTWSCSSAAGQATPSYDTYKNKWWNSATTYQRECSSSKTTATFQTSNTKSPQMTRKCAMIRTMPRRDEMLVVILIRAIQLICGIVGNSMDKHIQTEHQASLLLIFSWAALATQMLDIDVDGWSILDCLSGIGRRDESVI